MMKTLKLHFTAVALSIWCGSGSFSLATAQTQIVFDNSSNLINKTPVFFSGQEYGDELFLAGTARQVTEFVFAYYGNFGATPGVSYSLRFYENNGTDAIPGAGTALRPKSLLWDSGPHDLANGVNQVALSIPNILVPDHFTWTITLAGLDGTPGKQAALMLANPATVGAILEGTESQPILVGSYDDFWKKDIPANDDSWTLYTLGPGPNDPKGNFYARVEAIPFDTRLQITRGKGKVILSWPAAAEGYILESNNDLSAPANWSAALPSPTNSEGINYVTNAVVAGENFYRLRHP